MRLRYGYPPLAPVVDQLVVGAERDRAVDRLVLRQQHLADQLRSSGDVPASTASSQLGDLDHLRAVRLRQHVADRVEPRAARRRRSRRSRRGARCRTDSGSRPCHPPRLSGGRVRTIWPWSTLTSSGVRWHLVRGPLAAGAGRRRVRVQRTEHTRRGRVRRRDLRPCAVSGSTVTFQVPPFDRRGWQVSTTAARRDFVP